jgi:hypothetical protein
MTYTTNTLSYLHGGPVEGAWKLWEYTTTDSLTAVLASGYVADATAKGMAVGDFVFVANQANPAGYILQVQSMTAAAGNTPGTATLAMPAGVGGSGLANFRNLIDGGDFTTNPWQRGTANVGGNIANTVTYTADRWFAVGGASSSINVSQVTGVTSVLGFSTSLQFGRTSGNANTAVINLGQVLETADSIRCQGQQVTLSFWATAGATWSPANGVLNVLLASGTGTNQSAANLVAGSWTGYSSLTLTPQQNISPNSSPNTSVLTPAANIGQQLTTAWTRYSYTAVVPAGCTQLGVLFNATPVGTAGSADNIQIMGVQLEIGGQVTNFEHRDVQVELEIAQRYCWVVNEPAAGVIVGIGGAVAAANNQVFYMATPVQMVKAPTVTVSVGTFKVAAAAAAGTATGLAAGTTHTPNAISIVSTVTETVGLAASLQGGGGSGTITASADF